MNTTETKPTSNRAGKGTGPRPHVWKSGPDETDHASYRAWLQCRNQARFRSEPWTLSFEEWQAHWAGLWHRRGRTSQDLCITRRDSHGAWSNANVIIVTRSQHGQRKRGTRASLGQGPSDVILDDTWAVKP